MRAIAEEQRVRQLRLQQVEMVLIQLVSQQKVRGKQPLLISYQKKEVQLPSLVSSVFLKYKFKFVSHKTPPVCILTQNNQIFNQFFR